MASHLTITSVIREAREAHHALYNGPQKLERPR